MSQYLIDMHRTYTYEDTGEVVRCFYCDSDHQCPHRIAVVGFSSWSCLEGSYCEQLDSLVFDFISRHFSFAVQKGLDERHAWGSEALTEMWVEGLSCRDPNCPNEVPLMGDAYVRFQHEMLTELGAVEVSPVDVDVYIFFAENPAIVLDGVMDYCRQNLDLGDLREVFPDKS